MYHYPRCWVICFFYLFYLYYLRIMIIVIIIIVCWINPMHSGSNGEAASSRHKSLRLQYVAPGSWDVIGSVTATLHSILYLYLILHNTRSSSNTSCVWTQGPGPTKTFGFYFNFSFTVLLFVYVTLCSPSLRARETQTTFSSHVRRLTRGSHKPRT
jgi:hypothetical protein